jgi:2-polyprenyl-6-methoxyphenol hydroxylase-like FAD-dependent oxidoreductase
MVLARCLEASADIPEALRRYEAARFARISRIVAESRANAERVHNPLLADAEQARAFMDREFAPGALGARYDWLYEYDAMSVPI